MACDVHIVGMGCGSMVDELVLRRLESKYGCASYSVLKPHIAAPGSLRCLEMETIPVYNSMASSMGFVSVYSVTVMF